nr:immunoglobulin light chain junction region [Macaca mulatta]
CLQAVEFPWTF